MARDQSALANWSQYLALRGLTSVIPCFSVEQNLRTAGAMGSVFYRLVKSRREGAKRNIALSFPEWSEDRVAEVAERSMEHMFQLFLVDALVMPRLITPASWPEYVRLHDVGPVIDRLTRREGTIFITGHCGNWELLGYALSVVGFPLSALARPLDNPLINHWVASVREARGLRLITKWGAASVVTDLIQKGGRVGFIADQNAGDQGLFVPFFGRLASTYKSIALIAMRYDVPIVAVHARRIDRHMHYEIKCHDAIFPEDWAGQPDPLYYVTARFARAIESMVRAAPEQYLWLHRRWKSRPRHERRGEPMPDRLRAKLESLPWMTQAELDRIVSTSNDPNHHEAGNRIHSDVPR